MGARGLVSKGWSLGLARLTSLRLARMGARGLVPTGWDHSLSSASVQMTELPS